MRRKKPRKNWEIQREMGIIDGEYRPIWRVYRRIGQGYGKDSREELYPEGEYRTRREALKYGLPPQ